MMDCGHPLAARAVRVYGKHLLRTACWACDIEGKPRARARATGYNNAVEYSDPIAHNAQRPPVRLYSESEGVDVPEYRRNA
jgi:hypothetical protein